MVANKIVHSSGSPIIYVDSGQIGMFWCPLNHFIFFHTSSAQLMGDFDLFVGYEILNLGPFFPAHELHTCHAC